MDESRLGVTLLVDVTGGEKRAGRGTGADRRAGAGGHRRDSAGGNPTTLKVGDQGRRRGGEGEESNGFDESDGNHCDCKCLVLLMQRVWMLRMSVGQRVIG